MADGLSVAASVAGLIQIADIVVRRGYRYIRDVKNAEKSVERLIDEVNKLSEVLHSLKNVAERCEDEKMKIEPTAQIHHIEACLKTLQIVDTHLDDSNPATKADSMDNIKSKLKWPLNKSKVKELLLEVERHKSVMSLAMTASSMSALLVLLDRQESLRDDFKELKRDIEMDRAQRVKVEINYERGKWLDFLSPIEARKWQDSNIALRQPGTGIWFTSGAEFREWLSTERSKLWVYGIPGAGKTILMASAIQEALMQSNKSQALAYFYCDYKDQNTHDIHNILGSLAKQIAVQNEECFKLIGDFHRTWTSHQPPSGGAGKETAYFGLIVDLSRIFSSVMIIVDGLDEVSRDRSGTAYLLQSLNSPSNNIKTLFASRREVDLEHPLRDYKQLSIAAMSNDLRLYVASEMETRISNKRLRIRNPDLKEHIMRTLVEKADGMFRWVACQLDYLCECTTDRERREALTKLPPDLPSSYERILERINNSTNKANQRLVVRTLQWIMFAKESLKTDTLLEALAIEEGDDDIYRDAKTTEDEILHWASSLLRRSKDRGLELAHFTVKEFLFSIDPVDKSQFAPYSACQKDADIQISITCLTYLNSTTFSTLQVQNEEVISKMEDNLENHRFCLYAVAHWDSHAFGNMEDGTIMGLAQKLFCPTVNRQFYVYRNIAYYCTFWKIGFWHDTEESELETLDDMTPLHWAAYLGLPELSTWLLKQGVSATQMSGAGTPMNCALLGQSAIWRSKDNSWDAIASPERNTRHVVVELFLKKGASPYLPQSPIHSKLPLSIAMITEDLASCSVLLAAGAKFSASDLSNLIDGREYYNLMDFVFNHAITDISTIQPEARGVLFDIACLSFTETAKKALRILSSHPDALEWANSINFSRLDILRPEILGHADGFSFFYSLLANMQVDLRSTAVFPLELREFIVNAVEGRQVYLITGLSETIPDALLSLKRDCDSLLHIAIAWSTHQQPDIDLEIINVLLKVGYNISDRNSDGETPLHYATKYDRLDIFQLLMASPGAEDALCLKDHDGQSAFDYALSLSRTSIVDCIVQYQQNSLITGYSQMSEVGSSRMDRLDTSLKHLPTNEEERLASGAKRQKMN